MSLELDNIVFLSLLILLWLWLCYSYHLLNFCSCSESSKSLNTVILRFAANFENYSGLKFFDKPQTEIFYP